MYINLTSCINFELDFRNNAVSAMNQLLTCLRLFATGGHLSSTADFMKMDISTVSRIVPRVSEAIVSLSQRFIKMPRQDEIVRQQNKFYQIARFPKVIGTVDGTHIRILSPGTVIHYLPINYPPPSVLFIVPIKI